ncbi:hypothetical protein [Endozoicomonas sp. 4G]|uniref:hypothetical protein n=1 Tax=Endozoicomonas sp. 4G TaxID=2872754 RepID=UPI002078D488|nr:hypothetical protein [Endozoicomonas sp. 4G]
MIFHIENGGLLDDIAHPNQQTYSHQRIFVVNVQGYVWLVPYVESKQEIFLKTLIPSRKLTSNSRCFFKPLSRIASSALKKKHFADFLALY